MVWKRMGALLLLLAAGAACQEELGPEPEIATVMLYFPGNDTVFFDVESGIVSSGPIEIFGNADFTVGFFAPNGQPDERVTEARYRLDVTPANTGVVTFARGTSFSGTLNKVASGSTTIEFAVYEFAVSGNLVTFTAPINVN